MNNPSSTSSSREHPIFGQPPRRWATLLGAVLFIALNVWVARVYQARQQALGKPHELYYHAPGWAAANRDSAPAKIFFLGNSTHQYFLDFAGFEAGLRELTGGRARLFNLGQEAGNIFHYQLALAHLDLSPGTLVVIPVFPRGLNDEWPTLRGDNLAELASPRVIAQLGLPFYRAFVSPSQFNAALLQQVCPLFHYKGLIYRDLETRGNSSWAASLRSVFASPGGPRQAVSSSALDFGWPDHLEVRTAIMMQQFGRMLDVLGRRGIPHLVYFQPVSAEARKTHGALLERARAIVRAKKSQLIDMSAYQYDNENYDDVHPRNSDQLVGLLGPRTQETVREADLADPWSLGFRICSAPLTAWQPGTVDGLDVWMADLPCRPVAQNPDAQIRSLNRYLPLAFTCQVGGARAAFAPNLAQAPPGAPVFSLARNRQFLLRRQPGDGKAPAARVEVRYATLDPVQNSTQAEVNRELKALRLVPKTRVPLEQVTGVAVGGHMFGAPGGNYPMHWGCWFGRNAEYYLVLPAAVDPGRLRIELVYRDPKKFVGPLAEMLRRPPFHQ